MLKVDSFGFEFRITWGEGRMEYVCDFGYLGEVQIHIFRALRNVVIVWFNMVTLTSGN